MKCHLYVLNAATKGFHILDSPWPWRVGDIFDLSAVGGRDGEEYKIFKIVHKVYCEEVIPVLFVTKVPEE